MLCSSGAWLPLVCTLNCTRPPEEVREAFGLQREAITALAAAEAPGCSGLNFLPYIAGERTPNWPGASGVLAGIRPGSLRPGSLYRAALEGATFSLQVGFRKNCFTYPAAGCYRSEPFLSGRCYSSMYKCIGNMRCYSHQFIVASAKSTHVMNS